MKKSLILHHDSLDVLDELSKEQIADLFIAIKNYNLGKEVALSGLMKAVFTPFKNQFDRDQEKYDKTCERNRKNGKLGGKPKGTQTNPNKPSGFQSPPVTPDNDNDNDNDNVNKETEKFLEDLTKFIKDKPGRERLYSKDILNSFYLYRTEPIVKGKGKGHIKQFEQRSRSLEPRLDRFLEGTLGDGETPRLLKKKYGIS